ncbi:MAG: putative transcriptional regulator [Alteromonadaceae bacterium]
MIKCNLARILGEKKLKVAEVARDIDVHKNVIYRFYNETAVRVDLSVIEKLCRYLDVSIEEFFELVDDE